MAAGVSPDAALVDERVASYSLMKLMGPLDDLIKLSRVLARNLGQVMVAELETSPHMAVVQADIPRQLLALLTHVRHFVDEVHSVQSLADYISCSLSTMHRLFMEYTGMPPMKWVRQAKLDRGALLLATTDMPIATVGESVGMADQGHFTRLFHRKFNATPTEYRRMHCR